MSVLAKFMILVGPISLFQRWMVAGEIPCFRAASITGSQAVVGNGTLRELTERYEEIIGAYGLEEWAPEDFNYKEFLKGLTLIRSMPLCPGCLKGGGRDNCEMKACASNRNIDDCSECREPATCKHVEALQKMRSGALAAGLSVKTDNIDRQQLIEKWITEMESRIGTQ